MCKNVNKIKSLKGPIHMMLLNYKIFFAYSLYIYTHIHDTPGIINNSVDNCHMNVIFSSFDACIQQLYYNN